MNRLLLAGLVMGVLGGCSSEMDDLKRFVRESDRDCRAVSTRSRR